MKRQSAFKQGAFLLTALTAVSPPFLFAQTATPQAVVTHLSGQASLVPAALPQQPRSLKFRDGLFFQDRVNTEERSLVRMLLGGKAVVTVRELSEVTITEEL